MRSLTLACSFALCVIAATAQPVLDGSVVPQMGTSANFVYADYLPLTATGAGVTWDATGAVDVGTQTVGFGDPANSAAGTSFPDCDVVEIYTGFETFVDVTPEGMFSLGQFVPGSNITIVYTDPLRLLALPCALDTAWNDSYAGSYDYSGFTYDVSGTDSCRATGYGTLQLPWGDVTNVLRVEEKMDYSETAPGFDYHFVSTSIYYYKPGVPFFVAKSTNSTTTQDGIPTGSHQAFFYLEEGSIGIGEHAALSLGVQVVPNPASEQAVVLLTATGHATLEVIDARGRMQQRMDLGTLAPGLSRVAIDVSQLPAGLYTAIVRNAEGEQGMAHFVVAR